MMLSVPLAQFAEAQQSCHRKNIMRSTFTTRQTVLAVAVACAVALGAFSASAQQPNENVLAKDSGGQQVMSGFGLCVHGGFGPAPWWTDGCHPRVATPVAQYYEKAIPGPLATPTAAPLAVYEKLVFDADVLFDSNKSNLRAAGRDALDGFVGKIRGLESQSVMAIGYADRMGTAGSNQILSEERVATVKAYLVSRGVAAERVKTSGWAETRPNDRRGFIEISLSRAAQ